MLNSFRKHRNRRKYLCLTRHSESSNKILMWVSFLWTEQSREKINHCMLPGLLDPWPRIRGSEYNDEDGHQRKNHQDANLIMAPRIFTFACIFISSWCSFANQGTFNWRASSYPDFSQNYFLLKRVFDFSDNCDECRKPGFLRGNTLLAFLWFF